MPPKKKSATSSSNESSKVKYYQWSIFLTLFIGYGLYAYNRKSVSLILPELMKNGLQKSDAGTSILPILSLLAN